MVVVGHKLVQVGGRVLAAGVGMVEDHILNHAQTGRVQAQHHVAVLTHTLAGIDGVLARGRHVVHRIVAPVVGVRLLHIFHGLLLLRAIWRRRRERTGAGPRGLVLIHAAEVKRGQQVNRGQTRRRDRMQMDHAIALAVGKGLIRALDCRGHARVADAEIPDMQFVNAGVVQVGQRR